MNTCTLARFQCIYGWFAFSIAKASKASKILCRAFGPKCDYDGDIVICYFVFARMCVVQALPCIGLHLVVTTAWHLAALWRMCLQHAFYFVFHAFCFSVSCFNVSWFSWKILFGCFLCFNVSCFWKNYVSMFLVFCWKITFFNSRIVQYQESCSPQSFAEAHQLLVSNLARTSCPSFFYDIIYEPFTIYSNRLEKFFRHRYT